MRFKKGDKKPPTSGRKTGTANKVSKTVKETVLSVFQDLQADSKNSLVAFAKKYPREFYNIASKLIPTEIKGGLNPTSTIIVITKDGETKDQVNKLK